MADCERAGKWRCCFFMSPTVQRLPTAFALKDMPIPQPHKHVPSGTIPRCSVLMPQVIRPDAARVPALHSVCVRPNIRWGRQQKRLWHQLLRQSWWGRLSRRSSRWFHDDGEAGSEGIAHGSISPCTGNASASLARPLGVTRTWVVIRSVPSVRWIVVILCSR